jgi:hypothetical protein
MGVPLNPPGGRKNGVVGKQHLTHVEILNSEAPWLVKQGLDARGTLHRVTIQGI